MLAFFDGFVGLTDGFVQKLKGPLVYRVFFFIQISLTNSQLFPLETITNITTKSHCTGLNTYEKVPKIMKHPVCIIYFSLLPIRK